jgi:hypothetical protein
MKMHRLLSFETGKDIFTRHNMTGKIISLGNATGIYTDTFSSHWMLFTWLVKMYKDKEVNKNVKNICLSM